jgi:N-acetylglucosamine-6-phosphate deacetylase
MRTIITAGRLITPAEWIEDPILTVESGTILAVESLRTSEVPAGPRRLDFPGLILAPGWIDVHIHGGAGHDVMETGDAALARMEEQLAQHGVTAYLPTTVTAPEDRTLRALEHLGKAVRRNENTLRASPLGIHLEGPFISHARRGVHPPANLVQPSPGVLERFWQASGGAIRMMTIAPELPGAVETIQYARTLGIIASLGHSNATYQEARAGMAAGAIHATHTFNAMRPLDHREPGILGAVLEDEGMSADIIADGIHVDPTVVRLFLRAKGDEKAILITDAISATGKPDGAYRLGEFEVQVKDGRCEHEGRLAGSVLTLDRAVRNVMNFAGWPMERAVKLASLNPARLLDIAGQRGIVAPNHRADLAILTAEGKVVRTMIGGELLAAPPGS